MLLARCAKLRLTLAIVSLLVAVDAGKGADSRQSGDPTEFPLAETVFPQLEPILEAALSRSPTMIQEVLSRQSVEYEADADRSVLYPRIRAGGRFDVQREERLSANDARVGTRTYYDITATQPAFHWGSLRAQAEIGQIDQRIAERNFTEAYQLLANRIRDAYLQLVTMRIAQRNRALGIKRLRAQLVSVREQVSAGRLPAGAAASVEFAIESQELASDRAEYAFQRALKQFRILTGNLHFAESDIPEAIPKVTQVDVDRTLPLREEYVSVRGFERNASYFRSVGNLEADRLRLKIIRNELRPKFDAAASISQDVDDRTVNVENRYMITTYSVGIRVNWSIWDSKSSASRARSLQARIRRDENRLERLENDLIEAVETADVELGFATRSLKISERSYSGTESGYNSVVGFQKEGRASQDEVDDALLVWRNAEYPVCEARRDYLRTVAAFLAAVQADPLVERLQRDGKIPR